MRASRAIKELFGTVEVEMKNPFKRPGVVEASGSSASWVARVTFARVHRIDGNRRATQPNTTLMASTPRTAPDIAPGRKLPKKSSGRTPSARAQSAMLLDGTRP